jgi:hypothetical protein
MRRVLALALEGGCTAVVTGHTIHERPEWAMRLCAGYLRRMEVDSVPVNCQELDQHIYHVDGQVVCVETERLLSDFPKQYLGPAGHRIALVARDRVWGTDVDTIYDLIAARAIHDQLRMEGKL